MNNISDKNLIIILFGTIIVVFALIFSVKSPERKVIDSPIMWKEEFSTIFFFKNDLVELKKSYFLQSNILLNKLFEFKSLKDSDTKFKEKLKIINYFMQFNKTEANFKSSLNHALIAIDLLGSQNF